MYRWIYCAKRGWAYSVTYALLLSTSLALVVFVSATQQMANDFWLHAKIGEEIYHGNEIPEDIKYPYTEARSNKFNAHSWLAGLLFYLILRHGTEECLPYVSVALGVALYIETLVLVYWWTGGNRVAALFAGLTAVLVENYRHILRPELLVYLLWIGCVYGFLLYRRRRFYGGALYGGLMVLWSNIHGSFVLGVFTPLAYLVGNIVPRLFYGGQSALSQKASAGDCLAIFAIALMATGCTPFGFSGWNFVYEFSQFSIAKTAVAEWVSSLTPGVWKIRGVGIGLLAFVGGSFLMLMYRKKITAGDWIFWIGYVILAVKAIRFYAYLGIVFVLVLPWNAIFRRDREISCLVVFGGLISSLAVVVYLFGNASGAYPYSRPDASQMSIPMREFVGGGNFGGRVVNSYGLGAELIYRFYPRLMPSIDSRVDSYGDDYFFEHERLLHSACVMHRFIRKYSVEYLLMDFGDWNILSANEVFNSGELDVLLEDGKAVFARIVSSGGNCGEIGAIAPPMP